MTFVLAKVTKTVFAGRDPLRLRRIGSLRFSADGVRSPNSLRSKHGLLSGPAALRCSARFTAPKINININSRSNGDSQGNGNSQGRIRRGSGHG